ncbi:MAG: HAMP domain-containing histidine kinase [Lachnospiraceae bacterium]|nr:HAMP domain-containing histidine kinase [Lachnospiraceae bacterium]
MNNSLLKRIGNIFCAPNIDLRVRLFHILAMGGFTTGVLVVIISIPNGVHPINILANLLSAVLSIILLLYSQKTGRYQLCYVITILAVFIVFFPVMFFTAGGYHSGMPSFFVFATAFTVFMLEGRKAVIFSVAELLLYIGLCLFAYYHPDTVTAFEEEPELLTDTIVGFASASLVLGVCLFLHLRLYNEQQRVLAQQNSFLDQSNRAKNEFLANMSHEMRTPLTVISVNVQTVAKLLDRMGTTALESDTKGLLGSAQSEVMRLSRMVSGMLTLSTMSNGTDKTAVDLSLLLESSAETLRISLEHNGNHLNTDIQEDLKVFGNADLLTQVITNLIANAGKHTTNGVITLKARKAVGEITVMVADTGSGIHPTLLPHIFERGTTTGGTGIGLYLCKTIIESHGGRIWVESKVNDGTSIYFSLSTYGGQFAEGVYRNE